MFDKGLNIPLMSTTKLVLLHTKTSMHKNIKLYAAYISEMTNLKCREVKKSSNQVYDIQLSSLQGIKSLYQDIRRLNTKKVVLV